MNKKINMPLLKAALIRAVRTGAQTAVSAIGAATLFSDIAWVEIASMTLMAMLLSLLNSVATGLPEVEEVSHEH